MQIAPFMDDTLENFEFANRKELCEVMYDNMTKYGGLGLSANQIGLPYRMFVMGGHPQVEEGKVRYVFNITDSSLTSLTKGLKTYRTLPSSICGCPPMTNIRYGRPI